MVVVRQSPSVHTRLDDYSGDITEDKEDSLAGVRQVALRSKGSVTRRDPPASRFCVPPLPDDWATAHGERDGRRPQPQRRGLPELDPAGPDDRMVAPVLGARTGSVFADPGNPEPSTRLHDHGVWDVHTGHRPM